MATDSSGGWGRFVAESAASIVYLPGEDPSWRKSTEECYFVEPNVTMRSNVCHIASITVVAATPI
jgi:hypothetical protein